MERVPGTEPALSAWESGPSRALTCPELPSWLSASDREIPVSTGLNGTLMARRSWTVPCLLGHGQVILFCQRAEVTCSYWRPMEGGEVNRMPGTGWVGWPGSRSCRRCQQPVIWGLTKNDRWTPVNPGPAEDGKLAITDGDPLRVRHLWHDMQAEEHEWLAVCHVETCPHGPGPSKPRSPPEKPRTRGRAAKCALL